MYSGVDTKDEREREWKTKGKTRTSIEPTTFNNANRCNSERKFILHQVTLVVESIRVKQRFVVIESTKEIINRHMKHTLRSFKNLMHSPLVL